MSWQLYKQSKRQFRVEQRLAEHQYVNRCITELCDSHQVDHKYFWYLVNRHKKVVSRVNATRDEVSDNVVYDPDKVRSSWSRYFEHLYTPVEDNNGYDDNHKLQVESEIDKLLAVSTEDEPAVQFTVDEVKYVCQSLCKNKAPGWDTISAEHLLYGGNNLYRLLAVVFNRVSKSHVVPEYLKKAVIVPIPKGRDKNLLSKDNYRGISLLSVVTKVYEKLLMKWYEERCAPDINVLQGACLKHCSSLNMSLMLQEGIAGLRHGGNTVYVCLLDARKAFDTVWHKGLFYKLARTGCNIHLWRILYNFYQGFNCTVQVAGGRSPWFTARQGVHQGGPFSMKLYTVFNSDLLEELVCSGHGARLTGTNIACPSYADDIALVALHKPSLQALMDISVDHSSRWRYNFNPIKSSVLIFGRDECPARSLVLGDQEVEIVKCAKHLGVPLAVDASGLDKVVEEFVSKGRRSSYASLALGNRYHPVPPLLLSKLYWSVSIPQMTFGLELVNLTAKARHVLDSAHMSAAKVIQGLPAQSSNPCVLAPLQWWSMDAFLSYKRIMLLWRILVLPSSLVVKQFIVARYLKALREGITGYSTGPLRSMMQSLVECGLLDQVTRSIVSGIFCSSAEWKRIVKSQITAYERNKWMAQISMYKKLKLFALVVRQEVWPWWAYVRHFPQCTRECRTMIRLLVGEHCLASNPGSRTAQKNASRICDWCSSYKREEVSHFLFECSSIQQALCRFWSDMRNVAPPQLVNAMQTMSPQDLTVFCMSGFCCKYTPEWSIVYSVVCKYIHAAYVTRLAALNQC